jgi:hypothetical protein
MAIKIATTEVITDLLKIQNFGSLSGTYSSFYPNADNITTVIDMNKPIMKATLSAATTFTASNLSTGRTAILLLDLSASGYAPTFPSSFKWVNDTQPSWTGTRYWQLGLTAWDGNTVRVVATGYSGSGAPAATVDLGGTINTYSSGNGLGGYARTTFAIGSSGTIATSGTGTGGATTGAVSRTWLLSGSASDYQIKWDGTGDTSYLISNSGLGTWLNGGVNLSWVLEEDDNDSVIRSVSGTLSIRDTATSTVQDTVSVTISADFSP